MNFSLIQELNEPHFICSEVDSLHFEHWKPLKLVNHVSSKILNILEFINFILTFRRPAIDFCKSKAIIALFNDDSIP